MGESETTQIDEESFKIVLDLVRRSIRQDASRFTRIVNECIDTVIDFNTELNGRENDIAILLMGVPKSVREKLLKKVNKNAFDPWIIRQLEK